MNHEGAIGDGGPSGPIAIVRAYRRRAALGTIGGVHRRPWPGGSKLTARKPRDARRLGTGRVCAVEPPRCVNHSAVPDAAPRGATQNTGMPSTTSLPDVSSCWLGGARARGPVVPQGESARPDRAGAERDRRRLRASGTGGRCLVRRRVSIDQYSCPGHALCSTMQPAHGRRPTRETAAYGPLARAPPLHVLHMQGLSRTPETVPRNTEAADQTCWYCKRPVHTERGARNARTWWRGFTTSTHLRATNPTLLLVTALALCSRLGGCPTQRMPGSVGLPRNPVPV